MNASQSIEIRFFINVSIATVMSDDNEIKHNMKMKRYAQNRMLRISQAQEIGCHKDGSTKLKLFGSNIFISENKFHIDLRSQY